MSSDYLKAHVRPMETYNFYINQLTNTARFERRWWVRAWRAVKAFFGFMPPGTYVVQAIDHENGIVTLERL